MGFIDKVKGFLNLNPPALNTAYSIPQYKMMNSNIDLFGNSNEQSINNGYLMNNTVYSVINKITSQVKKADIELYVTKGDKYEQIEKHYLLDLLKRPNPLQGYQQFIEATAGFYNITGESFIHLVTADFGVRKGLPIEAWNINPALITKIIKDETGLPYQYQVGEGANKVLLPANEVIHLKSFNPNPKTDRGLSPIQVGRYLVQQDNDSRKAQAKLMQNVGASGILTLNPSNDVEFGPEQAELLQAKYYEKYGGAENYGKLIITPASMDWKQIGLSPVDLAIIESQKMSLRDICNLYSVPSVLLNDSEHSTYNNVREARKDLITQVVLPFMELFVSALDNKILPLYEKKDGKDYSLEICKDKFEELNVDFKEVSTALQQAWYLTPNEKRERLGYDYLDDEDMNKIYIPQGNTPIDMAGTDNLI